jgi:hypothetical protein
MSEDMSNEISETWNIDKETLDSCVRQCLWHRNIRKGKATLEQACILALQAELDAMNEVTDDMCIAFFEKYYEEKYNPSVQDHRISRLDIRAAFEAALKARNK